MGELFPLFESQEAGGADGEAAGACLSIACALTGLEGKTSVGIGLASPSRFIVSAPGSSTSTSVVAAATGMFPCSPADLDVFFVVSFLVVIFSIGKNLEFSVFSMKES